MCKSDPRSIRFPPDTDDWLADYAEERGLSVSEAVRRFVERGRISEGVA